MGAGRSAAGVLHLGPRAQKSRKTVLESPLCDFVEWGIPMPQVGDGSMKIA